jgi:catechol-2,3-dioxygenase
MGWRGTGPFFGERTYLSDKRLAENMDPSPSRGMIERIDHVNLVVNDMAVMIEFYRDVLGLRLTK